MRNIFLLPTNNPSRLISVDKEFTLLKNMTLDKRGKNIYITSDEEIKPNKYALINGVLCKTELLGNVIVSRQLSSGSTMDICKSEYSEIILTTDQNLIKNGVQEISEEFLQWFVKNPSCEEVEVDKHWEIENWYRIIIPNNKEESKQDCKHDIVIKYGVAECQNCGMEEDEIPKQESKQETPEEVELAILFHNTYEKLAPSFGYETREDTKSFDITTPNGKLMIAVCKEIIKWQQERMYNEEEVLHFLRMFDKEFYSGIVERNRGVDKWFKNFKKK